MKIDGDSGKSSITKIFLILVFINLSLFIIKFLPSWFFNSLSVRADALNSLGDSFYSIAILIGAHFAYREKDITHPHGHERIRPFLSLVIASSIFLIGINIVRNVIETLLYGPSYNFTPIFFLVLIISILSKFGLSRYLHKRGDDLGSDVIISAGKDSKADVLASSSALLGVLGAQIGFLYLDAIFGLAVTVWIFKTSYHMAKTNFNYLTGAAPSKDILKEIRKTIKNQNVSEIKKIEAHYVGPKIEVACEVKLPKTLNLEKVHKKEEEIKSAIEKIEKIDTAYVHIEPDNTTNKKQKT